MKKMLNKIGCLLCITILAGNMVGCGYTSEVKSVENKTDISFSWWGNDPRHLYTIDAIEQFEENNDDIAITAEYGVWNGFERRNRVHMLSHTAADVMQINYGWLSTFSPDGDGYYDLYQLSDVIDLSQYTKEDLAYGEIDGKLNAIPIAYNAQTVFFNKTIWDKYHLELPTTWDELFDAAVVMREDGIYPIGMVKKHVYLFLIAYYEQSTGKMFFDDNGNLAASQEELEFLLSFYKRLIDEKVMIPIEKFDRAQLTSGEVAGSVFWNSDIGNYCDSIEMGGGEPVLAESLDLGSATKRTGWYIKPATMYAISADTEHPEAAARLLNYLVSSEEMSMLQQTEKGVPVNQKALKVLVDNDIVSEYNFDANQKMLDSQENMRVILPEMEDEAIINIFKDEMDAYVYEKISLEEAAANILGRVAEYSAK